MESAPPPDSSTATLLHLATTLLHYRDFSAAHKYALKAQNPHLSALSSVLSASLRRINNHHDWYSILQLPSLSTDTHLITTQFHNLSLLLNPSHNHFTFADEAFTLVSDAFSVLSNPTKKSLYDHELHLFGSDTATDTAADTAAEVDTFWTACPYCYHLYEYDGVYEDCCLKCQNCQRPFHGAAVAPPPEDGYYSCLGFFPLGFQEGGFRNWAPFTPMFSKNHDKDDNSHHDHEDDDGGGDGDSDSVEGFEEIRVPVETRNGEWRNANERFGNSEAGGIPNLGNQTNLGNQRVKNLKSVAKCTKKLRGKGIGIGVGTSNNRVETETERPDLNMEFGVEVEEGSRGGGGGGVEMGRENELVADEGMEFFNGVDDIFMGIPIGAEAADGNVKASN